MHHKTIRITEEQHKQLCSGALALRMKHSQYLGMLLDKEANRQEASDLLNLRSDFEQLQHRVLDLQVDHMVLHNDLKEMLELVQDLCKRLGRKDWKDS